MPADITKVKRNIGKMIDQGAPDSDIDAYMADEGVTMDQLKFPSLTEPYDEKSTMQSVFDLLDPKTGKSIIYGNRPDPGPTEDLRRIARDSATRGFGDKALGPEAQAQTRASRERTSDWLETPTDVIMSAATSPYGVGGKLAAAGYGGVEGALDAYGHQDSWVPDPWKIGKGAVIGSGAGALASKGGEIIGGLIDRLGFRNAKKAAPFKSSDDLLTEADRRQGKGYSKFAEDYEARANRVKAVEAAQGKSRDEFGTMLKGMDLSAAERKAADAISTGPEGLLSKTGRVLDKVNPLSHSLTAGLPVVADALTMYGKGGFGMPWGTMAALGGKGVTDLMQYKGMQPSKREVDELLALMRDPSGKGFRVDDFGKNAARDMLAKFGIGAGKQFN